MDKMIRVGTRNSQLALWQTTEVCRKLSLQDYECIITGITSDGDTNLETPLYEAGIQGIFTRALDSALLENKVDVAVHSYKDVPTRLAKGLRVAAVLERGNHSDMMVFRNERALDEFHAGAPLLIATCSVRRKAQWLHRFANTRIESIRGNVQTRIEKLKSASWHGAIFAAAGLERLNISEAESGPQLILDWMLPAPAQGAIVVICRENDEEILSACRSLNHEPTQICTEVERDFLHLMQGGCSTPISALAMVNEREIFFKCNITATDGSDSFCVSFQERRENYRDIAAKAVASIINDQTVKNIRIA